MMVWFCHSSPWPSSVWPESAKWAALKCSHPHQHLSLSAFYTHVFFYGHTWLFHHTEKHWCWSFIINRLTFAIVSSLPPFLHFLGTRSKCYWLLWTYWPKKIISCFISTMFFRLFFVIATMKVWMLSHPSYPLIVIISWSVFSLRYLKYIS